MATRPSCPICLHVGSISSCRNGFYCCRNCSTISEIWVNIPEILYDVQVDRRVGQTAIKRFKTKPTVTDRIEQVLDVDSFQTRSKKSYTKYLVKWRDRPNTSDRTWINEATFRNADPEYYEAYVSSPINPKVG